MDNQLVVIYLYRCSTENSFMMDICVQGHSPIIFSLSVTKSELMRFVEAEEPKNQQLDQKLWSGCRSGLLILSNYPRLQLNLYKYQSTFVWQTVTSSTIVQYKLSSEASKQLGEKLQQLYQDIKQDKPKEEY
jgi:hypothetical protein